MYKNLCMNNTRLVTSDQTVISMAAEKSRRQRKASNLLLDSSSDGMLKENKKRSFCAMEFGVG